MNKREALIEMAIQRGASPELVKSAMIDVDRESVLALINQMRIAEDARFIVHKYLDEIIKRAEESEKLLSIADLFLTLPETNITTLIFYLTKYRDDEAVIDLLRQIMALEWIPEKERQRAAFGIFTIEFNQSDQVLNDEALLVRTVAVMYFEAEENTHALLNALNDEESVVRRIAVWYMGRMKIVQSSEKLQELLVIEEDVETLRGVIWSLGVLRAINAKPQIEKMLNHSHPLIRFTAQQTLKSLEST